MSPSAFPFIFKKMPFFDRIGWLDVLDGDKIVMNLVDVTILSHVIDTTIQDNSVISFAVISLDEKNLIINHSIKDRESWVNNFL